MHTDANTLDNDTLIEGDLCIVGAGAAGISIALEWANTSHKVILLEGGGFDVESEIQDLYRGESVGQRYFPLQSSRLHFFGGTTGHWAGFCAPFDPWDFEKRDWVPHSGWPISRTELDPFYERAGAVVELPSGAQRWEAEYWRRQDPDLAPLAVDPSKVWTKMWQFSTPTRFGRHYRNDIVDSRNIHLFTHANVCDIRANESVSAVEELEVRCLNGKRHRVRAKHIVLACGAIQNARMLLASNTQARNGLGNDRDLVGRYFMEHLEAPCATMVLAAPGPLALYIGGQEAMINRRARGELVLTHEAQREHQILNCSADLSPQGEVVANEETNRIERYPDAADSVIAFVNGMFARMRAGEFPQPDLATIEAFSMQCRSETSPNPDSRVMLSEERDALGVPRVKLDWRLTDLDKRTLRKTFEVLGQEIGRTDRGRIQIRDWLLEDDPFGSPNSLAAGGWHHMGTARMHDDPKQGVVDANCTVHGLANLHVAGSAAFTTSGTANPTLTLIALSLRLSDHLKTKV
jgi:choline dehydrogenase-like flavoprotein